MYINQAPLLFISFISLGIDHYCLLLLREMSTRFLYRVLDLPAFLYHRNTFLYKKKSKVKKSGVSNILLISLISQIIEAKGIFRTCEGPLKRKNRITERIKFRRNDKLFKKKRSLIGHEKCGVDDRFL